MNIGILDPLGKNKNPLTGEKYSSDYRKWGKIWSTFPAYEKAKSIIKTIKDNQVVLVVSSTGSGKTVLIPKYGLHVLDYKGRIAVTLPKQMLAKSSAIFAAKTLDVLPPLPLKKESETDDEYNERIESMEINMGEHVGYKYRNSSKKGRHPNNKLLYATDGTIVAKLINDPLLTEFDMVIIDEAHERKIQIDLLLYLLKHVLKKRPEFKLIIMSATVDSTLFKKYYNKFKYSEVILGGKRKFPIKSIFTEAPISTNDYLEEGIKIIKKLLKQKDQGDILFFVTSKMEGVEVCDKIRLFIKNHKDILSNMTCKDGVFCVEVFSGMSKENEDLAISKDMYRSKGDYCRKLLICTPVAESSMTFDGIVYVIDSGLELRGGYNAEYRAKILDKALVTQAQAKQRMGRAGRTSPGTCYHLYTKDIFENKMAKFPEPDIRSNDITFECLNLLKMDRVQTVENLRKTLSNFIEPPKEKYTKATLKILKQLGMIENGKITLLGNYAMELGGQNIMSPIAQLMGIYYKCSREVSQIMSVIDACNNNLDKLFYKPSILVDNDDKNSKTYKKINEKFNNAMRKFSDSHGDHITILKIFMKYNEKRKNHGRGSKELNTWCYDHFVNSKVLNIASQYYRRKRRVKTIEWDKINILKNKEIEKLNLYDRIITCLAYAFRYQIAHKKGSYYSVPHASELKIKLSKSSFLSRNKESPQDVLYHELFISSNKPNINIVSKISRNVMHIIE